MGHPGPGRRRDNKHEALGQLQGVGVGHLFMVRDHRIEGQMDFLGGPPTPERRHGHLPWAHWAALRGTVCPRVSLSHTHPPHSAWPTVEPGAPSPPLWAPPGSRCPREHLMSLPPHLHQAAAFALGTHEQPRGEAGDLKERGHRDALRRHTRVGRRAAGRGPQPLVREDTPPLSAEASGSPCAARRSPGSPSWSKPGRR